MRFAGLRLAFAADTRVRSVENFGESEVRDAHLRKAEYLLAIGDKDAAVAQYTCTFDKTVGAGSQLELVLTLVRIGFFFDDAPLAKRYIEQAKTLVEKGGDWDRRNRLKDYEAFYLVSLRRFGEAAELLIETLSTYNASELMPFDEFVPFTALCALVSLERAPLRAQVADAPELVPPRQQRQPVVTAVDAYLAGEYRTYFEAVLALHTACCRDRLLAAHASYCVRELRVRAYVQMLSAYRSVQLSVMAAAFGVSEAFLDQELARFIALGRVPCKIDRVGGVIAMQRTDAKAALYHETLKQGDALLNRIQKLHRVVNM